ncbi:MAG: hypothetical protein Q8M31_23625 [Beijerinckiaceae bacterium]|nr:hypothetical protein [Beijerinckiaceae bacterium]
MLDALIDNDVILKVCCYGIHGSLVAVMQEAKVEPAVLPLARYVVSGRIKRNLPPAKRECALSSLDRVLAVVGSVEADQAEIYLAASFEATAQLQNLELDGGESLLLAILIRRGLKFLLTGDKRAIRAIEQISADVPDASIACFEQFMKTVLLRIGASALRELVCATPSVDLAMTSCFGCRSPVIDLDSPAEGLRSYVSDLRKEAARVLIPWDDLSSIVS